MAQTASLSIGSNTYTVYALTADAQGDASSYLAGGVDTSAWDDANSRDKKKALISAARMLDRAVWSGTVTDPITPQPLQWPRDGATCRGEAVADGTIPDNIAYGQFELALALLEDSSVQDQQNTRTDLKRVKAGSAEVEYFKPPFGESTKFPTVVQQYVGCYLAGASNSAGIAYDSGTDVETSFTDTDFERDRGFA